MKVDWVGENSTWLVPRIFCRDLNATPTQNDDLSEQVPGFSSGGLTVLICGEASMLSASIRNMFQLCMFIRRFYLEEFPEAV